MTGAASVTQPPLRIAVVQFRSVALDVAATLALSLRRLDEAADAGADLVLFPELSLGGYSLDQDMAGARARPRPRSRAFRQPSR